MGAPVEAPGAPVGALAHGAGVPGGQPPLPAGPSVLERRHAPRRAEGPVRPGERQEEPQGRSARTQRGGGGGGRRDPPSCCGEGGEGRGDDAAAVGEASREGPVASGGLRTLGTEQTGPLGRLRVKEVEGQEAGLAGEPPPPFYP